MIFQNTRILNEMPAPGIKTRSCSSQSGRQNHHAGIPGLAVFIVLIAVLTLTTSVSGDTQADLIVTALYPNMGTGNTMFALEPNVFSVTIKNNGTAAAGASTVSVDGGGTVSTAAVDALAAGASTTVTVADAMLNAGGSSASITATADSAGVIAESDETNNARTNVFNVVNNGYKGKRFATGGSDITTQATYEGRHGLVYSAGNTEYNSASWTAKTYSWSSADLPIPAQATVTSARLYQGYTWNRMAINPAFTMSLNGYTVTPIAHYTDRKNYGQWEYPGGVYVYDVTSRFNTAGNSMTITPEAGNDYAIYGAYIVVVYQDPATTVKKIWINDEFDMLFAGTERSATSSEATAYAPFFGVDTNGATSAEAVAILSSADETGTSRFIFNSNEYGSFGSGYLGSPQIGFSDFNVTGALVSGTNTAGLQSYLVGSSGDNMVAQNAILVVTYADTIAGFSATPLSGQAPLAVQFTDTSTGPVTSWAWDFNNDGIIDNTTQHPAYSYTTAGTFTVNLTVTGPRESDSEVKAGYITIASGIIPLPGYSKLPTDPDHDGLYEDLNGNGRKDFNDIQVFYGNLAWIGANEPIVLFDFNGNGRIDFGDLQLLYSDM